MSNGDAQVKPEYRVGRDVIAMKAVFFSLLLFLISSPAFSVSAPRAPAWSDSGNYTVAFGDTQCAGSCLYRWLEERVGTNGIWSYVSQMTAPTAKSYTGKPDGAYYYRTVQYVDYGGYYYYYFGWTLIYSPEIVVHVTDNVPTIDPLGTQLEYQYETRRGDINSDGRMDIFVKRTFGGEAQNGVIDSVILQQTSTGSFTSVVPSSTQATSASGWPKAAIQVILGDFNIDGFLDILLKKVNSYISGALPQILFSSGEIFAPSLQALTPVTSTMHQFFAETTASMEDPDYFETNVPWKYYFQVYYNFSCYWGWGWGWGLDYYTCNYYPTFYFSYYPDYSVFNQDALDVFDSMQNVINDGEVVAGSPDALKVEDVFERVLDVEFFDGALSNGAIMLDGEDPATLERDRIEILMRMYAELNLRTRNLESVLEMFTCHDEAWGDDPISQSKHYGRNSNQTEEYETLIEFLGFAGAGFSHHGQTGTHNIGTSGNEDYRGFTTPWYGWQLIYDADGDLVTNPVNQGSYDFAPPANLVNLLGDHAQQDVTPWLEWGNVSCVGDTGDCTTKAQRLSALYSGWDGKIFGSHALSELKSRYDCAGW